jgi:selenocysteine-specific elongation factor
MPQTSEHLEILRLLGVKRGLTVITKADLVDSDMIELVQAVVHDAVNHTFLQSAPVLVVDAVSGRGIPELTAALEMLAYAAESRSSSGPVRLPIDRVFTVKGFGTVITGTLVSGRMAVEDALELIPSQRAVRVRGLQVHNQPVKEAVCGQRVAVNLAGIDRDEVVRGDALASPGTLHGVSVAAVQLELLESAGELADNTRLHVHAGTGEALARISLFGARAAAAGATVYGELRLESAMPLRRHDRFLIRSYSPVVTVGGGLILETDRHHRKNEAGLIERLAHLSQGSEDEVLSDLLRRSAAPLEVAAVAKQLGLPRDDAQRLAQESSATVMFDDRFVWEAGVFDMWGSLVQSTVDDYIRQRPLKPGMPLDELRGQRAPQWPVRVLRAALERLGLILDREWVRRTPEPVSLSDDDAQRLERVYQAVHQGGLRPEALTQVAQSTKMAGAEFDDVVERLFLDGRLVRLEDGLAISREAYERGEGLIREALAAASPRGTAELKDVLGVNRRLAVLFLELLDREHVTRRVGDSRELIH